MIQGSYFDARSARPVEASLAQRTDGQWCFSFGDTQLVLDPGEVRVSDRIGSIPRRLSLPGGAEFETRDNDGVDLLLHPVSGNAGRLVHRLERRWGIALGALAVIGILSFLLLRFGLPQLAGWAAHRVPADADRMIGRQVLQILDRSMLQPSQLPAEDRRRVRSLFARMTEGIDDGHAFRLELRDSGLGANALALPSGIIVVTDDMVGLAQHDEELMAVIAHEIGHVRGRHALRMLIQNAGVSALMVALVGDVGTVSAALASAGPLLMHLTYSRDIELEADGFSRAWLTEHGIDPARFDAILCRMAASHEGEEPALFLSSHPPVAERAKCAPTEKPALE